MNLSPAALFVGVDGEAVRIDVDGTDLADRVGQVDTLLPAAGEASRVAWFGPDATDVAERRSEARDQKDVRSGPLSDVLVRATVLTGGDVRILPAGPADVPRQGIGALLRTG